MEILRIVGERIRAVRKQQKLSQEVVAERADLHPIYISKVETGKVKASLCVYHAIANALGMSLAELVAMPEDPNLADSHLVALFQSAKRLDKDKQPLFVETVKGVLNGLGVN